MDFQGFRTLCLWHLRKWGQHYCIVLFSLLLPFHWPQNRMFYGHFMFSFQFSLLRAMFQQTGYLFIVELFIDYFCCMTSPAEMGGSGQWFAEYCGSAKVLRIFRRWKVAGATSSNPHRHTVAQHCINGASLSQWDKAKFDPSQNRDPLTDCQKNLWQLITSGDDAMCQISCKSGHGERFGK